MAKRTRGGRTRVGKGGLSPGRDKPLGASFLILHLDPDCGSPLPYQGKLRTALQIAIHPIARYLECLLLFPFIFYLLLFITFIFGPITCLFPCVIPPDSARALIFPPPAALLGLLRLRIPGPGERLLLPGRNRGLCHSSPGSERKEGNSPPKFLTGHPK